MPDDLKQLAARFRRDDETSPTAEVSDVDVEAALALRLAAATADADVAPVQVEEPAPVEPTMGAEPPSTATEAPPKPSRKPSKRGEKSKKSTEPASAAMRKTTVLVPSGLLAAVKAWTEETGRTNSDAVLTAYLNHEATVAEKFAATAEDVRRIELGLPTIAAAGNSSSSPDDPKVQLGLYIRATALDELSSAAEHVSLSRSEYVAELLAVEFTGQH